MEPTKMLEATNYIQNHLGQFRRGLAKQKRTSQYGNLGGVAIEVAVCRHSQ